MDPALRYSGIARTASKSKSKPTRSRSSAGSAVALSLARHERLAAPVYGDVRLLGGSELRGGTTYGGESHPVPGSWSGVPNADALAIVLGEPYDTRWPALIDRADGRQGLHFLSVPKWNSALRINAIIGDPPTSIAQPIEPDGRASMTYPSDFPFDIEKKDDRFTDRSSKFQAGWRFEHREQHFREVRKIKERIAEAVEASPDEAVHILIYHLRRGYSYHVKSALVEMLSPIARDRSVFDALVAEFEAPATDIVAEQSMGALSENPATRNHYKDVLARAIGPAARKATSRDWRRSCATRATTMPAAHYSVRSCVSTYVGPTCC